MTYIYQNIRELFDIYGARCVPSRPHLIPARAHLIPARPISSQLVPISSQLVPSQLFVFPLPFKNDTVLNFKPRCRYRQGSAETGNIRSVEPPPAGSRVFLHAPCTIRAHHISSCEDAAVPGRLRIGFVSIMFGNQRILLTLRKIS